MSDDTKTKRYFNESKTSENYQAGRLQKNIIGLVKKKWKGNGE